MANLEQGGGIRFSKVIKVHPHEYQGLQCVPFLCAVDNSFLLELRKLEHGVYPHASHGMIETDPKGLEDLWGLFFKPTKKRAMRDVPGTPGRPVEGLLIGGT